MRYRALTDIFPVGYPFLPDEEEVRRQCMRWWHQAYDAQSLLPLTEHLGSIVDPYYREYCVCVMHALIVRGMTSDNEDMHLQPQALEQLEYDFRRIIRRAYDDQIREEHAADDTAAPICESGDAVPSELAQRVSTLEHKVEYVLDVLAHQANRVRAWLWPTYSATATDEDKQTFENYLTGLCQSNKRSKTRDIKNYLEMKFKQGIILRPEHTNAEWEVLCLFGYNRTYQAYNEAANR